MVNSNYQIVSKIYESDSSLVYQGVLTENNQPIILKILKENYPVPSELTRYKQEYEIISALNCEEIIKAYDLQRYENSLVILLEDFGGKSLNIWLREEQFSLDEFLNIAIRITQSLIAIHNANYIHKDVNPANIVYNQATRQLKIIDFGISTALPTENIARPTDRTLEGTLAYISPEQTGRINRGVDYRTDFYSLGVTLYELLLQELPFPSNDAVELVYSHIAKEPTPPHDKNQQIPLVISQIVMKLLAKTPENRYQSAYGLKADLSICLEQLQKKGVITNFSIAQQDYCDRFQIPQKLYGRKAEIKQLMASWEQACQGNTEMMLVSGYSGIGKSALVNQIHQLIVQKNSYFVSGKFDQFKRDIPYAFVIQAFQELIRQLLTENEDDLRCWRTKILTALESNAQLIIDFIPEVELIIGKQPPLPKLDLVESQSRFNLVFQNFINVFTQAEHPLVIFFDDLQWADLGSLDLLKLLATSSDSKHLLILGAYRDNEVSSTHPLIKVLDEIEQFGTKVEQILLRPLTIEQINQLVADTVNCSPKESYSLAELIFFKTNGNPFFLTQLLYYLSKKCLLFFDFKSKKWQWDIEKIQKVEITDNVVKLMLDKIEQLPQKTQDILQLAACIGNQFTLDILATVSKKSIFATAQALWQALKEGLVLPLSNDYKIPLQSSEKIQPNNLQASHNISYKFLHDRVQQAAYALIKAESKQQVHWEIGGLLKSSTNPEELSENIFNIVNHLNIASELITKAKDKIELAKLNLIAGNKAKESSAYQAALKYLKTALRLLPENCWSNNYQLTLDIHQKIIETEYINSTFERASHLIKIIEDRANTIVDKIPAYKIKILYYVSQNQMQEAIDLNLKALKMLGITLSKVPPPELEIQSLIKLPKIRELQKLLAMEMLMTAMPPVYRAAPQMLPQLAFTMVNLCLEKGNSAYAAYAYSFYGLVLCSSIVKIESGYQFGQLSLRLLEKFDTRKLQSKVYALFYIFIQPWKKHISNSLEPLNRGFQIGLETGDIDYAAYNVASYCGYSIFSGENLQLVTQKINNSLDSFQKVNNSYANNALTIWRQLTEKLINGLTTESFDSTGIYLSEKKVLEELNQTQDLTCIFYIYGAKVLLFYIYKNYDLAIENGSIAEEHEFAILGSVYWSQYKFHHSLALLAKFNLLKNQSHKLKKVKILEIIEANQKLLKKWATYAPMNYQHKYELVEAEKARLLGKKWQASELYEKAIHGAKQYKFIHEEAIAYERAAEFYLSIDRSEISKLYLNNAHHCYTRWGAKSKVKQLEAEYPELLLNLTNRRRNNRIDTTITNTHNDGEVLDLMTVIKASQTITGEIKLNQLLTKLMKVIIENAGAQQGFLILQKDDKWVVEAEGAVDSDNVKILQSIPINSYNSDRHNPILPVSLINYVARTQENIVLDNAVVQSQFACDPYLIANRPKSILCTPLLNQGKLNGIIYLENNLTTEAFTSERIEILQILSSQAAISIENSRLYQTLEQRVEERTKELSQTLDVLKATQKELIFENDLLRSNEQSITFDYQVGGSLAMDSPTYVVRSADRNLYKALKQGEFCYILNPRQIGKSSLMVRMMHHLNHEGFSCGAIDMTRIGSENITPEQWYKGFAVELWRSFGLLRKVNLKTWWNERKDLSPVQRLGQFIEEVLLVEVGKKDNSDPNNLVIFIDEIDSVLGLNFPVNDFFALIRSCYNQRTLNRDYQNLTFALFGVATPSDLISDRRRTPFNIGQAIQLEGFKDHEAQPLLHGLTEKVRNPQVLLKEILSWTSGQPFLTQKLCKLIRNSSTPIPSNQEAQWIEDLVRQKIIENWESQDEPEHLTTIQDRLLHSEQPTRLLNIYEQIWHQDRVAVVSSQEEQELLLSGLVFKQDGFFKVHNRIYNSIFDSSWIQQQIQALSALPD